MLGPTTQLGGLTLVFLHWREELELEAEKGGTEDADPLSESYGNSKTRIPRGCFVQIDGGGRGKMRAE